MLFESAEQGSCNRGPGTALRVVLTDQAHNLFAATLKMTEAEE